MPKTVELRRHTAHEADVLTDAGISHATQVGSSMQGEYHLLVSSGAHRATQTLACFLATGELRCAAGVVVDRRFGSSREQEWGDVMASSTTGDLAGALRVNPDLVQSEAGRLAWALADVFESLPEGGRGMVVGHSPLHEAAVYGLTGEIIGSISRGGGVVVHKDGSRFWIEALPA